MSKLKPGIFTTEFWTTAASYVLGVLGIVVPHGNSAAVAVVHAVAVAAPTVASIVYVFQRSGLKGVVATLEVDAEKAGVNVAPYVNVLGKVEHPNRIFDAVKAEVAKVTRHEPVPAPVVNVAPVVAPAPAVTVPVAAPVAPAVATVPVPPAPVLAGMGVTIDTPIADVTVTPPTVAPAAPAPVAEVPAA